MINMKILKAGAEEFTGSSGIKTIRNIYMAFNGADAPVLMTAHREFRELDLRRVKERMRKPIMIDGRRVFEPEGVRGLGFVYRGVGNKI
ncbi:MAG: UDP binding domain-containing protein [Candidatus Methanoperedens sp.]|nr:UDP binding domain-containing protein [Candidatus Methanoperedens sp.]